LTALAAAIALLNGGVAAAQSVFLSEEEFRALTEGRVMRTDLADGTAFGIEEFGPGGSVVWHETDGTCLTGQWRAEGGSICYHYDGYTEPSCLRYQRDGDRLTGFQWDNAAGVLGFAGMVVTLTPIDAAPLTCAEVPVG
jgi:hypothetical protein